MISNPKLKEFAFRADCSMDKLGYGEGNIERFAELIIEHCMQLAGEAQKNGESAYDAVHAFRWPKGR